MITTANPFAAYGNVPLTEILFPMGLPFRSGSSILQNLDLGPYLSAQSAWQAFQGVKTLSLGAHRHATTRSPLLSATLRCAWLCSPIRILTVCRRYLEAHFKLSTILQPLLNVKIPVIKFI
ncbi:hypothetical protein B0H14DRAFT_2583207 [Mycena olivaceomarginata]|nr:hypothetical protein B0H14DRAFT_2583207 [Mycena olivaceomarginata]